ncbi:MAG: uracil-DNA glycosylase [Patulibacter minatonensis]
MRIADDEIREKYLERAIRELGDVEREVRACESCQRSDRAPVLSSGHPQADIMLIGYEPSDSELAEGVAFYGRAGTAILKSLGRLEIDPTTIYGTLLVKCPKVDDEHTDAPLSALVAREIAIVQPSVIVVNGERALGALNALDIPLARPLKWAPGEIQRFTPTCEAITTPDINQCLDEDTAKRAFWSAFRKLGDWYADQPPW